MGWPVDMHFALHCNDLCTLDARVAANSFTLFDFALQVRIVPKRRGASETTLRELARAHSRHLAPPVNIHRMSDELPGFPSPQFAITAFEAPRQAFAIPIDLRPSGWGVCVGLAKIGAALFTFASDSLPVCAEPALHQKLARGESHGSSRGEDLDPFAIMPPTVDHVRIRRNVNPLMAGITTGNGPPSLLPPQDETAVVLEHFVQDASFTVAVHVSGLPTTFVDVPRDIDPSTLARRVSRALKPHRPHCSLELAWPQRHPRSPDALLHVLVDLDHRRLNAETLYLTDCRGLGCELGDFVAFAAPNLLTAMELAAIVRMQVPCQVPPAYVLVNDILLSGTGPAYYSFPLLRLVSSEQCTRYERQNRAFEPATLSTHSILHQLPAFCALADTFEAFVQRAVGAFSSSHAQPSTTTTTAAVGPYAIDCSTTTTSTQTWVGDQGHPCDSLDLQPLYFHLATCQGEMLTITVRCRDTLDEVLFRFCRSLYRNGRLRPEDWIESAARLSFSSQGTHVFSQLCREGAAAWFWIHAPQWNQEPTLVRCTGRLSRSDVFRSASVQDLPGRIVTLRGGIWEASVRPAHGDILVIATDSYPVRSAPLMNIMRRVSDVQILLFRQPCPGPHIAADEHRHRVFWRSASRNCLSLFGLDRPGVRSTIAAVSIPPMVVCTGTLVLPTTTHIQHFYDECLATRFGPCVVRDTAYLDGDNALC